MQFKAGVTMLVLPPDGAPAGPVPTIIFLHGVGERGDGFGDLAAVAKWGLPKFRLPETAASLSDGPFPFLVVAPQCPTDRNWSDPAILDDLDALADGLTATGAADPARLYLTGFSMGGVGTFAWAVRRPFRFAAIVPVCGLCDAPGFPEALAGMPAWIAYAEDDEIEALATGSCDAAAALAPFGKTVERPYRLGAIDGLSAHVRTGDRAYLDPTLYTWMLGHRRGIAPEWGASRSPDHPGACGSVAGS